MTTHSLLTYALVPEKVEFYLIPDDKISDEQRQWLRDAHYKFVNADDPNDGMEFLSAALSPKEEYVEEKWKKYGCVWHLYKLDDLDAPVENCLGMGISNMYYSGMVM